MLSRWKWVFIRYARKLWVRAFLFALVGIISALAAIVLSPILPVGWASKIGADAIDNILEILASSMLVVATFSLSTMVSAYAAASSGTTPRVVKLLMADTHSQNAIATFIGGFLYSLVGIIALSTGLYGEAGRIVLFFVTILVAGFIVVTFIRSIDHVSQLGRVGDSIDRVAATAVQAMDDRRENPYLGGRPLAGRPRPHHPVRLEKIGYVQHLDMAALQRLAEEVEGEIHVDALPGRLVDPSRPVLWTNFELDDAQHQRLHDAFSVDTHRSYDQDPRFGVIVLAEIASKALSPGVNDPGTAIAVIAALVGVLARWTCPVEEPELYFDRIYVPPILVDDLFDDAFAAIGNDCASSVAVGVRLQKALLALARTGDDAYRRAARHQSTMALARARLALSLPEDNTRLAEVAAQIPEPKTGA
ncbi:DUF2254 domain-containing protein [Geminicoccus roseus]|uniref:DUF2254 domain-containing protein n=1 Tax=Geminicoccus roseus TaxID=404900 RepID=UPI0003F7B7A1|nr:DUF2254 domain-containing protein [Geminicoccus roseus]